MSEITLQQTKALAQAWKHHAKAEGYKKGTRTYAKLEAEFFSGVIAAVLVLGRTYPQVWILLARSGRSVSETYLPDTEVSPRPDAGRKENES
jgi:hypothetical protein